MAEKRYTWSSSAHPLVDDNDKEPTCNAPEAIEKRSLVEKLNAAKNSIKLPKLCLTIFLWIIFGWALYCAWQAKINYKLYDPFEVLGVSPSAAEGEIKSAFKKLSRLHHPDKATPENREKAEVRFVEISKAYKSLTDEKMRKNWEEYGNPDGIRTFALGVALPSWLVNSSNRMIVLALYCLAFGIGLPFLVKQWWSKSKNFTKDGIRHSSMSMFFRELKENSSLKKILEIVACASEFEDELSKRSNDSTIMEQLLSLLDKYDDPLNDHFELPKKITTPAAVKAYTLLYCHFHRFEVVDSDLKQDQAFIVSKASKLVPGLHQIAMARQWLHPALNCMALSQYLVQGMWENQSPLLQLPYITQDIAKHSTTGRKNIRSIADLLDMSETDRRSLLQSLNDKEYAQVLSISQTFPMARIDTATFKILGQDHITPGGLVTCQVRLSLEYPLVSSADGIDDKGKESMVERNKPEDDVQTFEFDEDGNLLDDVGRKATDSLSTARPIYSPRFPNLKRPFWWVSLVNKNNTNFVALPVKVLDLVDRKTVVLQFPAPAKPMGVSLLLVIKSDSVVGVDITKEVKFTVVPPQENSPGENWEISGDEEDQAVPFSSDEE